MCFPNSFDSWYKIMLPDVVISSLGETGYIGMLKHGQCPTETTTTNQYG